MGKLEGKVAVVTGGGRGVGRAICLAYAEEGADVIVNYAGNHAAANEVVAMIEKMGRRAVAVQGRVEVKDEAVKTIQAAVDNFGRIDVLVNNAGATKPAMLIRYGGAVDAVVNIHMKGPSSVCRRRQNISWSRITANHQRHFRCGLVGTTARLTTRLLKAASFPSPCQPRESLQDSTSRPM